MLGLLIDRISIPHGEEKKNTQHFFLRANVRENSSVVAWLFSERMMRVRTWTLLMFSLGDGRIGLGTGAQVFG